MHTLFYFISSLGLWNLPLDTLPPMVIEYKSRFQYNGHSTFDEAQWDTSGIKRLKSKGYLENSYKTDWYYNPNTGSISAGPADTTKPPQPTFEYMMAWWKVVNDTLPPTKIQLPLKYDKNHNPHKNIPRSLTYTPKVYLEYHESMIWVADETGKPKLVPIPKDTITIINRRRFVVMKMVKLYENTYQILD